MKPVRTILGNMKMARTIAVRNMKTVGTISVKTYETSTNDFRKYKNGMNDFRTKYQTVRLISVRNTFRVRRAAARAPPWKE
jgi:hypothetical protein